MRNPRTSSRDRLREVAEENTQIFESGSYEAYDGTRVNIESELAATRAGTSVVPAEPGAEPYPGTADETWVKIVDETTLDALYFLHSERVSNMAVLNFASATTPGGGYLRGSNAQEESLCRATTLHDSLSTQTCFYAQNAALGDAIYNNAMIVSPQVSVIRDHFHFLQPEPISCTVLTCPAPNRTALIEKGMNNGEFARAEEAIKLRIALILDAVARLSPGATILGGWACGVFGNDPAFVANCFVEALKQRPNLGRIHFAIPELTDDTVSKAFLDAFHAHSNLPR